MGGFGSVFAYNFDAPPNMRQCDRLRSFGGTTADFYGFTEVNYPTWELEEWNPAERPCGIPEPHTLAPSCFCAHLARAAASLPVELQSNSPSSVSQGLNDGACPARTHATPRAWCRSDAAPLSDCVAIPVTGESSTAMLSVAASLVRAFPRKPALPTRRTPPGRWGRSSKCRRSSVRVTRQAPNYTPTDRRDRLRPEQRRKGRSHHRQPRARLRQRLRSKPASAASTRTSSPRTSSTWSSPKLRGGRRAPRRP